MSIAIIGAGAFGAGLACALASQTTEITLWARDAETVDVINTNHLAPRLPGIEMPSNIKATGVLGDLAGAKTVLLVLPAQQTASFLSKHAASLPNVPLVLCAKGIDLHSFEMQSEIAANFVSQPLAVLTGPSFAEDLAQGLPTALTLACADAEVGRALQHDLSTDRMRLYLTSDIIGAQLGGALKNVIAIAAGIVMGAGLGESARAALLTRGFAEMRRLGVAMGGQEETFVGLSGLGDLALTCSTPQSRNFALGFALGRGTGAETGKTVEGVATARAAVTLSHKYNVEMPITQAVAAVVSGEVSVRQAMDALLSRPLKQE